MELSAASTRPSTPPNPLRAILVEDSQIIRDSLVPTLAEMANTEVVAWATSSTEASQALADWHGQWQLIIIDLFLASGTGLDILAKVRNREPGQYALVLSNYATADIRRRCFDLKADGVFDKSTEIEAFLERCAEIDRSA
ncbi:response regulator [Acidovorax sp. FG27]|uniref:response regulator n=1 Tax=Acidovorax sp. FG27 TaxID=3133652 RepID=UPI0030E81C6A